MAYLKFILLCLTLQNWLSLLNCLFLEIGSNSLLVSLSYFIQNVTKTSQQCMLTLLFSVKKVTCIVCYHKISTFGSVMLVVRIRSWVLVACQISMLWFDSTRKRHAQLHMSASRYHRLATCFINQNWLMKLREGCLEICRFYLCCSQIFSYTSWRNLMFKNTNPLPGNRSKFLYNPLSKGNRARRIRDVVFFVLAHQFVLTIYVLIKTL